MLCLRDSDVRDVRVRSASGNPLSLLLSRRRVLRSRKTDPDSLHVRRRGFRVTLLCKVSSESRKRPANKHAQLTPQFPAVIETFRVLVLSGTQGAGAQNIVYTKVGTSAEEREAGLLNQVRGERTATGIPFLSHFLRHKIAGTSRVPWQLLSMGQACRISG